MLTDAQLPNVFWAEAVNAANYIQNRVLTRSTNKTPYELWYGRRADARHMNVFGSKCFVHVPKEDRRKLDNTATDMILIGYDEQSKAYRCYDMIKKKVTISRDVRFINQELQKRKADEIEENMKVETAVEIEVRPTGANANQFNDNGVSTISSNDLNEPFANELQVADDNNVVMQEPRRSSRPNKGIPPIQYVCAVIEPKTLVQAMES